MGLCDDVRRSCAEVAAGARFVRIDVDRLGAVEPGRPPELDPESPGGFAPSSRLRPLPGSAGTSPGHPAGAPAEPSREDACAYWLTLDAINFGSGWFPTLRKRPGRSGYFTVACALADRFRAEGPWSGAQLRALDAAAVATVLGQDPAHELMALYARALRELGAFLGERSPLDVIEAAGGSAERLAETLASGMPMFDDRGFWKRAQIAPSDLALAGVAEFGDLDRLTIFADNLVPHVLRVDGVLVYERRLAALIDGERLLPAGAAEREIRACAVHACELIAGRLGVPPRVLDVWLWNRGQGARYKARPRHRTRTVCY